MSYRILSYSGDISPSASSGLSGLVFLLTVESYKSYHRPDSAAEALESILASGMQHNQP